MQSAQPLELGYAPPPRPGHSPWSLVGFALALLSLAVPAMMGWTIWVGLGTGSNNIRIGVNPSYYVFPSAAILLCAFGIHRRPKLFPVLGIFVSLLATGGTLLIVSRTW